MIGSGAALYISGAIFEGQLTATSGDQPEAVVFEWDISITSDANDTQNFVYFNDDGDQNMQFTLSHDLVSTSPDNCTFENSKDIKFYINTSTYNGKSLDDGSVTYNMPSGNSVVTLTAEPHPNRCSLAGNITLNGILG